MRLFKGEVGLWFTVEWLPPYLLVAAIIPLAAFWKTPEDDVLHAALHVLSAGDLLAINFCLILSAIGALLNRGKLLADSTKDRSYVVEAQLVVLIIIMLVAYGALKVVPVDVLKNSAKAWGYSALNVAVSLWSSTLIYAIKIRE